MLLVILFNATRTTEIYTYRHSLSLHYALPIYPAGLLAPHHPRARRPRRGDHLPPRPPLPPDGAHGAGGELPARPPHAPGLAAVPRLPPAGRDRKSTRLNSRH